MADDRYIDIPEQSNVSAVRPQTNIYLCAGIEWDNVYKHVRLFQNRTTAETYVRSKAVRQINNAVPVRNGELEIRIPYNEMIALNCNYCIYQNLPYSTQYLFAFITNVRWLSINSCIIEIELDVFQNNIYDVTIQPSFVVRDHVSKNSDIIGSNVINENFETGEYVVNTVSRINFGTMRVFFYTTGGTSGDFPGGAVYNNVYAGALLASFPVSDVTEINNFITGYQDAGRADSIIAAFMAPSICQVGSDSVETNIQIPRAIEGYMPKNNKMFTYPYCFVSVDNNSGTTTELTFERSNAKTNITVRSTGVIATSPAVYTVPVNYQGLSEYNAAAIINSSFPMVAFATDTFQAWLAQNKNTIALSALGATAGAATSVATGNILGALGSLAGGAALLAKIEDRKNLPKQVSGKVMSENINTALGYNRIDFYTMTISANAAKIIDNFWEVYGYPQNTVKQPALQTRSSWNYVETRDIAMHGTVNMDDLSKLRNIFNSGVFLWHTSDVGNFSLENL